MEVAQPCGDLVEGTLRPEHSNNVGELVASLNDICEGRGTQLERDVLKVGVGRVVVVSDDVWVIVGLLENLQLAPDDDDEMGEHAFDGDNTTLEQAFEHSRATRAVA